MYPVFLDIKGKPCLVVGGGEVAFRKTEALLEAGADRVRVVAPLFHPGFAGLRKKGIIKFSGRKFRLSDLKGAELVVCATDCEETNSLVGAAAAKNGALVNVVDRPALCNFIAPAVFRNGALTIAVSTGGASPALAKKIRIQLAKTYGGSFAKKVEALRLLRVKMLAEKTAPGKLAAKRAYFKLLKEI